MENINGENVSEVRLWGPGKLPVYIEQFCEGIL